MSTVTAIAIVMAIIQFCKKLLPTLVEGTVAMVLVVIASVGVTLYKFIAEGLPITLAALTFLIAVIVGAMSAYSLIKVATNGGAVAPK